MKPPKIPLSAEEALRRTGKLPRITRRDGESQQDFITRYKLAVRNAASRLRRNYGLENVWADPSGRGYLFDPEEIERKKAARWVHVPLTEPVTP